MREPEDPSNIFRELLISILGEYTSKSVHIVYVTDAGWIFSLTLSLQRIFFFFFLAKSFGQFLGLI